MPKSLVITTLSKASTTSFAGEESHPIANPPEAATPDSSAQSSDLGLDGAKSMEDHSITEESRERANAADVEESSELAESQEGEPQLKRPHRGPENDPRNMKLKVKPRMLERKP